MINQAKIVIGKLKDEACGIAIIEFVGLRNKMCYVLELGKTLNSRSASLHPGV